MKRNTPKKHARKIPEQFPISCDMTGNPKTYAGFLFRNFWYFFGLITIIYATSRVIFDICSRLFGPYQIKLLTELLSASPSPAGPEFWEHAIPVLTIVVAMSLFLPLIWLFENTLWGSYTKPRIVKNITLHLTNYVHRQSMCFINKTPAGKINQQINDIVNRTHIVIRRILVQIPQNSFVMIIGLTMIAALHWTISMVVLGLLVLQFIWMLVRAKGTVRVSGRHAAQVSQLNGAMVDSITNAVNVRAMYGRERELGFLKSLLNRLWPRISALFRNDRIISGPIWILEVATYGLVVFISMVYFAKGEMTLPQIVFTLGVLAAIDSAKWGLCDNVTDFLMNYASASRNYLDMNAKISVACGGGDHGFEVTDGDIDFKGVYFKYGLSCPMVLKNLSINIRPGERIGIIGGSGSGKTTIIKLLMRLYDCSKGEVAVDSQNVKQVALESLRRGICMVPQEVTLFNRSIMENLRYVNPRASKAEVIRAAQMAGAHDFITSQPGGYNTHVGDRGSKLSAHERRRIAIARAFLQPAKIMIIDQTMDELEGIEGDMIRANIEKLSQGKTTIIITNQFSMLEKMDRIIVLKNGCIAETGTHKSLLRKQRGIYKKMYEEK